jgi:hypothetical protein
LLLLVVVLLPLLLPHVMSVIIKAATCRQC